MLLGSRWTHILHMGWTHVYFSFNVHQTTISIWAFANLFQFISLKILVLKSYNIKQIIKGRIQSNDIICCLTTYKLLVLADIWITKYQRPIFLRLSITWTNKYTVILLWTSKHVEKLLWTGTQQAHLITYRHILLMQFHGGGTFF